jgi:hypothetical protein
VSAGIRDTAAWHVIEQILEHVWGLGEDLDDEEALAVCKLFWKAGGSWRGIMDGDQRHARILEESINDVISARKLQKIAHKISGNV